MRILSVFTLLSIQRSFLCFFLIIQYFHFAVFTFIYTMSSWWKEEIHLKIIFFFMLKSSSTSISICIWVFFAIKISVSHLRAITFLWDSLYFILIWVAAKITWHRIFSYGVLWSLEFMWIQQIILMIWKRESGGR